MVRRQGREAPLVELSSREDFENWLERKPREVPVGVIRSRTGRVLEHASALEVGTRGTRNFLRKPLAGERFSPKSRAKTLGRRRKIEDPA